MLMGPPAPALPGDVRAILFGGQRGFFLKLSPSATTNTHTARRSVLTPRACNSPTSWRVVNGAAASRARSHAAIGPDRVGFLWPFILPGFSAPVSRRSLRHFDRHDGAIDSACAIARSLSPASDRASARSRRSSEYGRVIHAGLPLQQES